MTSGMPLRPHVTGGDAWQFWPSPRRALTPTPPPRGGCRQAPCVMAWGRGAGGGQGGPGLGGFCPTECWEASERVGILLRGPGEEPRWLPVSICVAGPRAIQGATVLAAGAGCLGPWGSHGGTRMRGVARSHRDKCKEQLNPRSCFHRGRESAELGAAEWATAIPEPRGNQQPRLRPGLGLSWLREFISPREPVSVWPARWGPPGSFGASREVVTPPELGLPGGAMELKPAWLGKGCVSSGRLELVSLGSGSPCWWAWVSGLGPARAAPAV